MKSKSKPLEKFLCEIWKSQKFVKALSTYDGQSIKVIDTGEENKDLGGPDFKNARIKIGSLTYFGDVEIDSSHSDWKAHGHNLNKRYNKVIFHAVLTPDNRHHYVYSQDGRRIQSVSLDEFIDGNIRKNIQSAIDNDRKNRINKMPCLEINELMSEQEKIDLLFHLGVERFKHKCTRVYERLKEIIYLKQLNIKEPVVRYDLDENFINKKFTAEDFKEQIIWQQLVYEMMFEALGYSKNKDVMLKLAKSIDINFYRHINHHPEPVLAAESILLNVSGLLPDIYQLPDESTSAYLKKITEIWASLKQFYDGRIINKEDWHFFKLRPQNFPTIRIAAAARLIHRLVHQNILHKIITSIEANDDQKKHISVLRNNLIVKGEGFWSTHYTFEKNANIEIKYLLGLSRADEILINVMLPAIYVYFQIFNKKTEAERVYSIFINYTQKSENTLVDEVNEILSLNDANHRSVLYQGMIELFRNYCSKDACLDCSIGKKVFS